MVEQNKQKIFTKIIPIRTVRHVNGGRISYILLCFNHSMIYYYVNAPYWFHAMKAPCTAAIYAMLFKWPKVILSDDLMKYNWHLLLRPVWHYEAFQSIFFIQINLNKHSNNKYYFKYIYFFSFRLISATTYYSYNKKK
jgi:hypothetical protein